MKIIVNVPFIGVNDVECKINAWEAGAGALVKKGDVICVLETTKSTIDVEAENDGYYYLIARVGDTISVGKPLYLYSTEKETGDIKELVAGLQQADASATDGPIENRFTKKAQLLLERNQIALDEMAAQFPAGKKITESDVTGFIDERLGSNKRRGLTSLERVGIIGGVSGGGALILVDSLLMSKDKNPAFIFDRDEKYHGQEVLGVPIVGPIELLDEYIEAGKIDTVVIAFNRNLVERKRVFEELKSKGVRFTNVIDPHAHIRNGVTIGEGNVILANVYIGACSEIGDNNFISANVYLEHGNVLGSGNAFGPAVATSGNVKIGSGIRFGTGIFIEPNISIGDNAVISSGAIITESISSDTVVRVTRNQQLKPLN